MSNMSSLERVVYDLLHNAHLTFQQEKIFDDCRRGNYRFDFYIPSRNALLEVQGNHHYEFISKFFKSRSDFLKAQERDRLKISYALSQRIDLYCIPYWEIQNLHTVEDLFNPKFLARSKFHNDEVWRAHQNLR